MPILNITGKRVKVGDEFTRLSAADQQKTVNEIAAQLGLSMQGASEAVPPPDLTPGSREYADWAAAQARAGKKLPQVGPAPPTGAPPDTSLPEQIMAGTSAAANAVPIAGPSLLHGLEAGRAFFQHMTPEQVAAETKAREAANPTAATIGAVTGTVAPYVLASTLPVVSTVLGLDASLPLAANVAVGSGSQAAIGALDALVRGEDPGTNALVGAAGGAAGPLVGAALGGAGRALAKGAKVLTGRGESAAQDMIAQRIAADIKAGNTLSAADTAYAQANNIPLVNADLYGANVRGLVRDAGVADPTTKQVLADAVTDRFLTQNQRAADWIRTNTGAPVDVYAARRGLDAAAKAVNNPAYKKAYSAPAAQSIFTPEIGQLMQSSNFRDAIKAALRTSNEEAALTGGKALENPFVFNQLTGGYSLRPGVKPTLEFWDHVQRALRRRASQVARSGEFDYDAGQINRARGQLNAVLDATVPEFNLARRGAAAAFGADDALEAGQKFATAKMSDIPEAAAEHAKFTPAEKKLFATGFASTLIDRIGALGDNTNIVTNRVFSSPEAKAQIELALGKKAVDNLEPFLRVENTMNLLKSAVQGGSDTVAKLIGQGALGYGAGSVFGGSGWDPRHWSPKAMLIAAGLVGSRAFGKAIDKRVLQETARLLASNDPTLIQQAVKNAMRSANSLDAVKAVEHGISIVIRGGAPAALTAQQPEAAQ